jgi:myosin heavy subunit
MQKLTKLGVVNFADYPQQDINIKGNAVIIKASNGTGKTLLMTALYPALLTLELQKSLNMGQKTNRKLGDLLNGDPAYIYGQFFINNEPITIVTAYQKNASGITKRAYVLDNHDITFFNDQKNVLSLPNFERTNKITETFSSIKDYQSYIARNLYHTSLDNFKTLIQLTHKITSPSIISSTDSKNYNMEDLLDQVADILPSLMNDDAFKHQLTSYSQHIVKATGEQRKIHSLLKEQATVAKARSNNSNENQKALKALQEILGNMFNAINKNANELDALEEELQELETQREQHEIDQKNNQEELEIVIKELESRRQENRDIEQHIHDLKKDIKNEKEKENNFQNQLNDCNKDLSEINTTLAQKEQEYNETLKKLEQTHQPVLPFAYEQWPAINKAFKNDKKHHKKYEQLETTIKNLDKTIEKDAENLDDANNHFSNLMNQARQYQPDTKLDMRLNSLTNEQRAIVIAINELNEQLTQNEKQQKELQQTTEPKTHFIATNAQPLYTQIDFKENISENDQRRIEALMQEAGFIELLTSADTLTKGAILCQHHSQTI